MAQPASLFMSRELTRVMPFTAQKTFVQAGALAGQTFVALFDIAVSTTDPNQLLSGASPAGSIQPAIGPLLDAVCFTDGAGGATMLVEFQVDKGAALRTLVNTGVPVSTLTNISGLRITARYCKVTFTNVTAGALIECGAWVRSS